MGLCTFEKNYFDYQNEDCQIFTCDQDSQDENTFCIFHDKYYLENNERERKEKVIEKLHTRIQECLSNNEALYCIGYILPDIKISQNFHYPVYFNDCIFQIADFSGATFLGEADFSGATFLGEADFSTINPMEEVVLKIQKPYEIITKSSETSTFSKRVNFMNCIFYKRVNFSNIRLTEQTLFAFCTFSDYANFFNTSFNIVNFSNSTFLGEVNFLDAEFEDRASFHNCIFSDKATFSGKFNEVTHFNYVTFEDPDKIRFEVTDMSKVSFVNSNITRIIFSDNCRWGEKNKYQIIEDIWFEDEKERFERQISIETVISVYRNLRENYEFRRRYDEAGNFFIREMELKRKYRKKPLFISRMMLIKYYLTRNNSNNNSISFDTVRNGWIRQNFSLIGWYYNISRYGESIAIPSIVGFMIIFLSSFIWLSQSNPSEEPTFPSVIDLLALNNNSSSTSNIEGNTLSVASNKSNFIGLDQIDNRTQWSMAIERSIVDFLPLFSFDTDIKTGLIDYMIKIFGGGLTFGLIIIALRRKFERKYYH